MIYRSLHGHTHMRGSPGLLLGRRRPQGLPYSTTYAPDISARCPLWYASEPYAVSPVQAMPRWTASWHQLKPQRPPKLGPTHSARRPPELHPQKAPCLVRTWCPNSTIRLYIQAVTRTPPSHVVLCASGCLRARRGRFETPLPAGFRAQARYALVPSCISFKAIQDFLVLDRRPESSATRIH